MTGRTLALYCLLLAGFGIVNGEAADRAADQPLVYAAASLTEVLQQVSADYRRDTGRVVRLSFGSTATLARQIEAGARADLFIAADRDWMDYVDQRSLIARGSRRDLLGNRLVLIAPAGSGTRLELKSGMTLRNALGPSGRLALADPASVPAGKYARSALRTLGAWDQVESRIVASDNVRMALLFVARGEAPLGVVYLTDAKAEPRVEVIGEFPAGSHPPIVYPAALTTAARTGSAEFLEYLAGAAARARFAAAGFSTPADARSAALECRKGDWDFGPELGLFQGEPRRLATAKSVGAAVPALSTSVLWELRLVSKPEVSLTVAPGRKPPPEAAFAGIARFRVPTAGRYRVTVDGPFWIDVLRNGQALAPLDFMGHLDCPPIHKAVEYELPAGEPLTLQLTAAARDTARIVILSSARTARLKN